MPEALVLDSTMYYEDTAARSRTTDGRPTFVFLHGNPVSSHLWRKVLPALSGFGRCLAPDLIGMGRSGKPPVAYRYDDHARYLDAWFDGLELSNVILVGIDWGASLGFDWARRNASRTRGIAFMETIVKPMSWAEFPAEARPRFEKFRTPLVGEQLVLNENRFLEGALSATVLTPLAVADREVYCAPYPTPESRRPLLEWSRSMPIEGAPAEVVARVESYGRWLGESNGIPKLLIHFDGSPTLMIGPELVEWCKLNIVNLDVRYGGRAGHLAPEDRPDAIVDCLANWCSRQAWV